MSCPTHKIVANVYGRITENRVYLTCGCELFNESDTLMYDVFIVKVFKQ
ncbi:MAG: hypothetical protein ACFFAH_03300 [Promethearchaeota archaeon]